MPPVLLAPEPRRAIEATSAKEGAVEAIATCGDLPELRSLTMPLIEELDLEIDTLDWTEVWTRIRRCR